MKPRVYTGTGAVHPLHVAHRRQRWTAKAHVRVGPGEVVRRDLRVRRAANLEVTATRSQQRGELGVRSRADDDAVGFELLGVHCGKTIDPRAANARSAMVAGVIGVSSSL